MKIVFSPRQLAHNPEFQILPTGRAPYPESPERVRALLDKLAGPNNQFLEPDTFGTEWFARVHDPAYLDYLEHAHRVWRGRAGHNSDVFVTAVPPPGSRETADPLGRAGWFCRDTFTPIAAGTYESARAAADTALTAAELLRSGQHAVYALCRPPGHHAGRATFGGFCYLNNAAIAAAYLVEQTGRTAAILDLDYHHGNGTQEIFYNSDRVFCASIHADPDTEYPYFSGWADETGAGAGQGQNLNLALPRLAPESIYRTALRTALEAIAEFNPAWLILAFGADICRGDPEGSFDIGPEFLAEAGQSIAALQIPTIVVQEGGYVPRVLADAAANLIAGLGSRA